MSTLVSSQRIVSAPVGAPRARLPQAPRALVTFLLAASVAALAVVADQLVSTWADGHLLLAWMVLWAVVFAGSLLLSSPARRLAQQVMVPLNSWARHRAEARAEARFLALARKDNRVMADLQAARDRADAARLAALTDALAPLGMVATNERSEWEAGPADTAHLSYGRRYQLNYI
ncbi:MAG: hypothetical protein RL758_1261 [Pseudomonadota bacterium]|jgi:hypothetical protein